MTMNPFDAFDGPAQEVLTGSYQILMQHRNNQLDIEHLLMSLLEQPGEFARYALDRLGVDINMVRLRVEEKLTTFPQTQFEAKKSTKLNVNLYITPRLQQLFTRARQSMTARQAEFVTPRDLLLAIVDDPNDPAAILLERFGLNRERLENLETAQSSQPPANLPAATAGPMETAPLTHFNEAGRARMVDVSEKAVTGRRAVARGEISMQPETLALIREGRAKKGDVLAVAQVAGIMAAKKTSEIIPMCHPLMLSGIDLRFEYAPDRPAVFIEAEVKTSGQTGVEMEALTAVSAAALTIYDMVKATDKGMRIENIRLVYKSGGKSGDFEAE